MKTVVTLQDRKHAAYLLSQHLQSFRESDSVVVAIPHGGVEIGYHLANYLHLPLDIVLSKPIKDPTNSFHTIGYVCQDGIALDKTIRSIPQDYIYHQTEMIRHSLPAKYRWYKGDKISLNLLNRTVILVADHQATENEVLASIRSLSKQQPSKIIVTMPIVCKTIFQLVEDEQCELYSLITASHRIKSDDYFQNLPTVTDEEVRLLLSKQEKSSLIFT